MLWGICPGGPHGFPQGGSWPPPGVGHSGAWGRAVGRESAAGLGGAAHPGRPQNSRALPRIKPGPPTGLTREPLGQDGTPPLPPPPPLPLPRERAGATPVPASRDVHPPAPLSRGRVRRLPEVRHGLGPVSVVGPLGTSARHKQTGAAGGAVSAGRAGLAGPGRWRGPGAASGAGASAG